MAVDRIAVAYKVPNFKHHDNSLITSLDFCGQKVLLIKPTTYMNLSGEAALSVSTFYKIPAKNIIIIHDDIDLAFGVLRLKFGGGHAGHNGIRDIIKRIGPDFWRLRIGIGRSQDNIVNYVLANFNESEETLLEPILGKIAESILPFVVGNDKQKALFKARLTENLSNNA
jgi:PTH1 family peptidyl-tRNA hydrolase